MFLSSKKNTLLPLDGTDGMVGGRGKTHLGRGWGGVGWMGMGGSRGRGKTRLGWGWGGVEWVDGSVCVGGGGGVYFLYVLGAEILYKTCFVNNSTQKASPEELQVRISTNFNFVKIRTYSSSVDSDFNIKERLLLFSTNINEFSSICINVALICINAALICINLALIRMSTRNS